MSALSIPISGLQNDHEKRSSLGIYTKRLAISELRVERYALQSAVRASLMWYQGPQKLKASRMRVIKCLRTPIATKISVLRRGDESGGSAFFRGVCLCGSVWTCPVCSAKISEARRVELDQATQAWRGRGGHLGLLTLTFPHCSHDELSTSLPRFTKALQRFSMSRAFRRSWAPRAGLQHRVRATEFTFGENGWHPHVHVLLFLDRPLVSGISEDLVKAWQRACIMSGLREPSAAHGVDLRDGSYASNYVGKWGLSHELTKANQKHGREGSRTPWDILRGVIETGQVSSALPFVHYALATKGTRQLCWSKGARADLGLAVELSDDELVKEAPSKTDQLLGMIKLDQWRQICFLPEGRTRVLEIAESQGAVGLNAFLFTLV